MPTTTHIDFIAGVRDIGARTNAAGSPVDDMSAEEDRSLQHYLTRGWVNDPDAFIVREDSPPSMTVLIGSGTSRRDLFVVRALVEGQHPYLVQLNQTEIAVTLTASGTQSRTDEIYLVVHDDAYDSSNLGLPQIGYREGDEGAGAPGPDSSWQAYVLLATITVGASVTEVTTDDIVDERTQSIFTHGIPIGQVTMWPTLTAPPGHVSCDGQELDREIHRAYFRLVGTTFGAGDGSTTFNAPNFNGRFPAGTGGSIGAIGAMGGAASVTLNESQIPSHVHAGPSHRHGSGGLSADSTNLGSHRHNNGGLVAQNDGSHQHALRVRDAPLDSRDHGHVDHNNRVSTASGTDGTNRNSNKYVSGAGTHNHNVAGRTAFEGLGSHDHGVSGNTGFDGTGDTDSTGGDSSHENRPPFLGMNFIVFVGV